MAISKGYTADKIEDEKVYIVVYFQRNDTLPERIAEATKISKASGYTGVLADVRANCTLLGMDARLYEQPSQDLVYKVNKFGHVKRGN